MLRLGALLTLFVGVYLWNPLANGGPLLCPMVWLFDLVCPFCGVTRGVDSIMRGGVVEGIVLNPLSALFVLWALMKFVVWSVEWIREIRFTMDLNPVEKKWWDRGVMASLALIWLYLIVTGAADHVDEAAASALFVSAKPDL